jgi:hypothetical protein
MKVIKMHLAFKAMEETHYEDIAISKQAALHRT